jgi:hypothetical protein
MYMFLDDDLQITKSEDIQKAAIEDTRDKTDIRSQMDNIFAQITELSSDLQTNEAVLTNLLSELADLDHDEQNPDSTQLSTAELGQLQELKRKMQQAEQDRQIKEQSETFSQILLAEIKKEVQLGNPKDMDELRKILSKARQSLNVDQGNVTDKIAKAAFNEARLTVDRLLGGAIQVTFRNSDEKLWSKYQPDQVISVVSEESDLDFLDQTFLRTVDQNLTKSLAEKYNFVLSRCVRILSNGLDGTGLPLVKLAALRKNLGEVPEAALSDELKQAKIKVYETVDAYTDSSEQGNALNLLSALDAFQPNNDKSLSTKVEQILDEHQAQLADETRVNLLMSAPVPSDIQSSEDSLSAYLTWLDAGQSAKMSDWASKIKASRSIPADFPAGHQGFLREALKKDKDKREEAALDAWNKQAESRRDEAISQRVNAVAQSIEAVFDRNSQVLLAQGISKEALTEKMLGGFENWLNQQVDSLQIPKDEGGLGRQLRFISGKLEDGDIRLRQTSGASDFDVKVTAQIDQIKNEVSAFANFVPEPGQFYDDSTVRDGGALARLILNQPEVKSDSDPYYYQLSDQTAVILPRAVALLSLSGVDESTARSRLAELAVPEEKVNDYQNAVSSRPRFGSN